MTEEQLKAETNEDKEKEDLHKKLNLLLSSHVSLGFNNKYRIGAIILSMA